MKKLKRAPIPQATQNSVLLANRHACCVCQKPKVQLHHIDGNPSNNEARNIAALCLSHHDLATMQAGLTKKLQPNQVSFYKSQWEARCRDDVKALSRERFTFYYCIYKNPPRLLEAYYTLSDAERVAAVGAIRSYLAHEQSAKDADKLFGLNAVPALNHNTQSALQSIIKGEAYPSYLKRFKPHEADPNYSADFSTQEAMSTYHLYDLWCQCVAQVLVEARGSLPLEDLYQLSTEQQFDERVGSLLTFKLSVTGKSIHLPKDWKRHPVGTLSSKVKCSGSSIGVRMQIRNMYLFSDTAALNLRRGRISGLGVFNGKTILDGKTELTIVPLIIGAGGWNLYPEKYLDRNLGL